MRDFGLEVFFSTWEFKARHHMTASDVESLSLSQLLEMASPADREAFDSLWLGYTQTWGDPILRDEIAQTYQQMKQDNILCFAGAGEGIYAVMKTLLGPDDHMIVPVPNYQSAETIPLSICAVTGVTMDYDSQSGWSLDIDAIKAALRPNTKAISVNFPHNPTGHLLDSDTLDALISLCRHHGLTLFSDEVYRGIELNLDDQMPQIADIYEKGVSLNVMSKAYGLPGLRIGWIASQDRKLLEKAERYKHYLSICNSGPSEQLSVIALRARQKILSRNRQIMADNLLLLEDLFNDYPHLFEWHRPKGGCVAYPAYKGGDGVEAFTRKLVEESGIILLPSSIYHSEVADSPAGHFRIGFGRDSVFKEGISALRTHLEA